MIYFYILKITSTKGLMNKERGENLGNPIVQVEVIQQHCPSIEDEMLLNRIIFDFNNQAPGAIHTTEEVKTSDTSYCLKVRVDKKHLEEFKNYMRQETNIDII